MSKLYIVPTPIGNLEDMTFRAIRVLKEVDLVLAEDTRTSKFLFNHFEITTPLRSYHMHNEHKVVNSIVEQIAQAENGFALISDAGTPAISDPGFLLVRECIANDLELETLPGATAFVPALVNSGFPCDKFHFEGFLPQKKGRQKRWGELAEFAETLVLYESPYRIVKLLNEVKDILGEDTQVSLSRELSKKFEENLRGTPKELLEKFRSKEPKGEFVVVIRKKEK
ncbi:16S rRNA (cytidine(1402)-2'-O)-methyltransferase [Parvicella tangerina]|uniref:Ribosomal RNA small subunit methyltransferase I n=1 Tax=Parvicella tangerina TaxID=2829795 RepID=A0A916JQ06_9FLAO|nr:16S rRNA (cytidine(1402)-2'-O)-methyltransferase [Parvicella tangerina]CAG5085791.1 Ribosomal RNA small subunit methyltransferase I [Parvicella tangerina]